MTDKPKKRIADVLIKNLTDFRDALRGESDKKFKVTTLIACEKCGNGVRARDTRGGWCPKCNEADKAGPSGSSSGRT